MAPRAQAGFTHPRAAPEHVGGSPWPHEPASGRPKVEDAPCQADFYAEWPPLHGFQVEARSPPDLRRISPDLAALPPSGGGRALPPPCPAPLALTPWPACSLPHPSASPPSLVQVSALLSLLEERLPSLIASEELREAPDLLKTRMCII